MISLFTHIKFLIRHNLLRRSEEIREDEDEGYSLPKSIKKIRLIMNTTMKN